MQIDIFAQEIPENTKIWRCFPGWRYGLRDAFREQNCVFLEFPDIEFDKPLQVDENLHAKIYAAQQLAELVRLTGPDSRPTVRW